MKLLHTSDWHVGKAVRGRSRAGEHRAVLAEIAQIAADHEVDLVLVAGDLFETAAPTAEAEEIVYRALLALAGTGAEVAVIAGNHDNARRLRAVEPLLELGRVHVITQPAGPDEGGVRTITGRSGERLSLALLPFVSQRGIVRAEQLMDSAAFENAQRYADRMRLLIETLAAALDPDLPSVMMAHAYVLGGQMGGGERLAHLVEEYAVTGPSFPPTLGYVALGHLHRPQQLPGATAIHYCGSPLQLDFGEEDETKQVNVVEVQAGVPAKVTAVPLRSGWAMKTLTGTIPELVERIDDIDDECWLRVRVTAKARAGLADEVRDALGERVVDVQVDAGERERTQRRASRRSRAPQELFAEFCAERDIDDHRITTLFADLYDEFHQDHHQGVS